MCLDSWMAGEMEHLSLRELLGGAPSCGAGRTWVGRLRGWTSFSVGAPLGNLVGGSSTGPCEGSGDRHLSPQGPC
jgi:hypothetical protein